MAQSGQKWPKIETLRLNPYPQRLGLVGLSYINFIAYIVVVSHFRGEEGNTCHCLSPPWDLYWKLCPSLQDFAASWMPGCLARISRRIVYRMQCNLHICQVKSKDVKNLYIVYKITSTYSNQYLLRYLPFKCLRPKT